MTVEIQTPEGVKVGSAVREIYIHRELSLFPGQGGKSYYVGRGQAVVIDLGKRGEVFAIMRGILGGDDYAHAVALKAFPKGERTSDGEKFTLTPEMYPMFVRFADLKDPKTVQLVYDGHGQRINDSGGRFLRMHYIADDRFPKVYDPGVDIKGISVEVVDDPLTTGIEKLLPWLLEQRGYLSGQPDKFGDALYQQLETGDFARGLQR